MVLLIVVSYQADRKEAASSDHRDCGININVLPEFAGCLSRGSRILNFSNPGSAISDTRYNNNYKKRRRTNCCPTYCNFTKLLKFKQRIYVFFTQKIVTKLWEICVWDPPEKQYPGSGIRGQDSTRSRIHNTARVTDRVSWYLSLE